MFLLPQYVVSIHRHHWIFYSTKKFNYVIWQSLRDAPRPSEVLTKIIKFLSDQKEVVTTEDISQHIARLLIYLKKYRCLLIFDNFESVLRIKDLTGKFREGYEGYGHILQQIWQEDHKSCLVLTSREIPSVMMFPTNSMLQLTGIKQTSDIAQLLKDTSELPGFQNLPILFGSDQDWLELMEAYSGNPLALKLVSQMIRVNFKGNINDFLHRGKLNVTSIEQIIEQQFNRLTNPEQATVRWLAIEREPVPSKIIQEDIISNESIDINDVLFSLWRRSFIERTDNGYTLQNVIIEYITDRFVDEIFVELTKEQLILFNIHALIKAQAKEYIRNTQLRLILDPLKYRLLNKLGNEEKIGRKIKRILTKLRNNKTNYLTTGYAGGNILNLLVHLRYNLSDYDFSYITIRQAYLVGAELLNVNFAHANFIKSEFTETFSRIFSVAYSPDGKRLVAGTENGEIRIWQVADGQPLQTRKIHTDIVWSVRFSPDGNMIASGGFDGKVGLYDLNTDKHFNLLGHTNQIRSVTFSPDGKILASSGGGDGKIRIWDIADKKCINILEDDTKIIWVYFVTFSTDGCTLASGNSDSSIKIWDVKTKKCEKTFRGHTGPIRSVAFNPDGSILASGSDDETIRLWDIKSGDCFKIPGHNKIASVAFSPDGSKLASGDSGNNICLWDVEKREIIQNFDGHSDWVRSVIFSPAENILASGSDDQTIRFWDINTGQCVKILRGYANPIYTIKFENNNRYLASGEENMGIRLWDVNTEKWITLPKPPRRIRSIAFSPDNCILACGSEDQLIHLWDMTRNVWLYPLRGHTHQVFSVTFSHSGDRFASGASDLKVLLWNVKTWKNYKILEGHTDRIRCIAFSPDDKLLASSGFDKTIRLWDLETEKCKTLEGHLDTIWSVGFSNDGRKLASGSDDTTIKVWDIDSQQILKTLEGHNAGILSIAFQPDSNILASGSADSNVKLWDISTGECLYTLEGHKRPLRCVAFSSDGQLLASCGDDETIKVWDMQKFTIYKELKTLYPYDGMNIKGATGLTDQQIITLKTLGAVE